MSYLRLAWLKTQENLKILQKKSIISRNWLALKLPQITTRIRKKGPLCLKKHPVHSKEFGLQSRYIAKILEINKTSFLQNDINFSNLEKWEKRVAPQNKTISQQSVAGVYSTKTTKISMPLQIRPLFSWLLSLDNLGWVYWTTRTIWSIKNS